MAARSSSICCPKGRSSSPYEHSPGCPRWPPTPCRGSPAARQAGSAVFPEPAHVETHRMTELLSNYVAGRWQSRQRAPVRRCSTRCWAPNSRASMPPASTCPRPLALHANSGGAALRALTYRQRAGLLAAIVKVLQANRDAYYEIATANSRHGEERLGRRHRRRDLHARPIREMGRRAGRRARAARRRRREARQGAGVPVAAPAGANAAAWRCSSTPSTSPRGACGKRRRPRCCRACP